MGSLWKRSGWCLACMILVSTHLFAVNIVGRNGKTLDVKLVDVASDGRIVFRTTEGDTVSIAPENIAQPSQKELARWLGTGATVAYFGLGEHAINKQQALRLAEKGDEMGDAEAAAILARCLLDSSSPRMGFAAAMRAASRGSSDGTRFVGIFYELGVGVTPSRTEAKQWYRKAYGMGAAYAAVDLARLAFREGKSVEAADWTDKAVERFRADKDSQGLVDVAQLVKDYGATRVAEELFALAKRIEASDSERSPSTAPTDSPPTGGTGTGWFVSKHMLLTCWHVVQGCTRLSLYLPEKKQELPLTLVAHDIQNDIALLRVSDEAFACPSPVSFAQTPPALAAPVFTLGFPMQDLLGDAAKYTEGSVSALRGLQDAPTHMQVSVPIQPGNSGGPVLNAQGEAIGMITATLNAFYTLKASETLPQNVNYALKLDYILPLLKANGIHHTEGTPLSTLSREQMVKHLSQAVFQIRARP